MNTYKADLHIHSVLSPCGDLEMSPANIIQAAVYQNLDIIAITDHNSTLNCEVIKQLGKEKGILVIPGAEVTSREEVHCLAYFGDNESCLHFQEYLEAYLPPIPNTVDKFGYQVVVNREEEILLHYPHLLINGINQSLDQIGDKIHSLGGIFIPAHIDRPKFSLISQLGFIPPDLRADAFEISRHSQTSDMIKSSKWLKEKTFIRSSDAHFTDDIGKDFTHFHMNRCCFEEIKMAINKSNGFYTSISI